MRTTTTHTQSRVKRDEEVIAKLLIPIVVVGQCRYNICLAQSIEITTQKDSSQYFWVRDKLRQRREACVVIMVIQVTEIRMLLPALLGGDQGLEPEEFLFVASESWGRRQELLNTRYGYKVGGSLQ